MTDKQIIIDGVDVSGCKHYKNRTCIADYCLTDMPFGEAKCELNPNCYYKQLKRTEFVLQQADQNINDLESMLENTERRENELKIKLLNKEQECKELKKNYFTVIQQRNKAEQTLTEIKEIAQNVIKNVSDRCIETTPMYYIHKQILQKISEVEDESNN